LNGKGTIHFEQGDTRTNATGLRTTAHLGIYGSKPRSVFAVMRRNSGRSAAMLINIGTLGVPGGYFGLCDQSDSLWLPSGGFTNNIEKLAQVPASWHILGTVYNGVVARGYVNGALQGEVWQPLKTADTQVEIGLRSIGLASSNTWASDGDFAELLIYDQALSTEEMRQVEDYLGAKWFHSRPISTATSFVWADPRLAGMTGFTYSRETGRFLISRTENGRDSVWVLDAKTIERPEAHQILQGRISDAKWIGAGKFAYTSTQSRHPGLVLMDSTGVEMDRLFEHGNFRWFGVTPDRTQILFWGSVSNLPSPGIWQYDVKTERLDPAVPYADHPSPHAGMITPSHTTLNLGWGRDLRCVIFPPSPFDPHKKYPLILGDTLVSDAIHGPMFESGMAACGAFVAIVERNNWGEGIEQWADNVLKFYQTLIKDPAIDPSQVFLFGASAETEYMSQLAEKTPGLWKGMILLNPGKLPDFSQSPQFQPRPKILLSAGGEEHEDAKFKKYQQDALQWGVLVEIHVAPGETHRFVGKAGKLQRAEAVMRFIFEE
jgi:predicted esterase